MMVVNPQTCSGRREVRFPKFHREISVLLYYYLRVGAVIAVERGLIGSAIQSFINCCRENENMGD